MDVNSRFRSHSLPASKTIILEKDVSALEVIDRKRAAESVGGISVLPKGSRLEICGSGFNARTFKVRCDDRLFFVFEQDIYPPREPRRYFRASSN